MNDRRRLNLASLREPQTANPSTLHGQSPRRLTKSLLPNSRSCRFGLASRATKTFIPLHLVRFATFFGLALVKGRLCNKGRFRTEVSAFELIDEVIQRSSLQDH